MAENTKKYLDLAGLTKYDGLIKGWVNGRITAEKYDDTALKNRVGALETLTTDYATVKSQAANSVAAWTKFLAGSFTTEVTPTLAQLATKDDLSGAISELKGNASTGYDTLAGLETEIKKVATNLSKKNVDAEGETGNAALVSASAAGNKVTVASTKKLQDAVALAESALQDVTVATGDNNGEIKVQGHAVAVKGLGSAAYTDATAYDAAGAAAAAQAAAISAAAADATTKAGTAKSEAIEAAAADATTKAGTAKSEAIASAKSYTDEREVVINGKISSIEAAIQGGTHFIGVLDALPLKVNSGDIFVAKSNFGNFKKDLEYIYDGTNWYELGDSSANAQAIANLESNKADKSTTYTKDEVNGIKTNLEKYADDAKTAAISAAADDATSKANAAKAAAIEAAAADATTKADAAKAAAISAAAADATSKANTAEVNAISAAAADATTKAGTAETNAKSYADGLFNSIGAIDITDIEDLFA